MNNNTTTIYNDIIMNDTHMNNENTSNNTSQLLDSLQSSLENSEAQFMDLINAVPSVVVMINTSGEITLVNQRVIKTFGYSPRELIGKPIEVLLPESFRKHHTAHRASYFKSPVIRPMGIGYNLSARRKDGSVFPVEIGLGHLDRQTGVEAIAFVADISERKRVEEALQAESAKLVAQAQRFAHIGTWEVNLQTGDILWSDEFFRICGLEPNSVAPSSELATAIIHHEDRDKDIEAYERLKESGTPFQLEKRIVRPTGEIRWVLAEGQMITNETDGLKKLIGAHMDITERKQAQQHEFELSLEKERIRLLTEFIQNTAHEFRTPLSIINSSVYIMTKTDVAERRISKAEVVVEQVSRMTKLLDALLLMVKVESLNSVMESEINVVTVITEVCEHMRDVYGEDPKLTVEIPSEFPLIAGNADCLFNAFKHLLDNAYRFTPSNGMITIRFGNTIDKIWIDIQDTGAGISEADLPNIFLTFWRHDQAHSTPGFGIGLAIVKGIIDQHHGKINVESSVGEGSTFRVTLPIQ